MSSRINTLEPNGEPLAVLLASIVARISVHDFPQAYGFSSQDDAGGDIARHAQRAIAGISLGIAQPGHRRDLIATVRLFVAERLRAGAPLLRQMRHALAAGVSLLRNIGRHAVESVRRRAASVLRLRPAAIPTNTSSKIGVGLAVAAAGLALVLIHASGRFARPIAPSGDGGPAAQTEASGAGEFVEERPLRDSKLAYTRANVRYCTFQQIRLETLGPITEGADLVVFNALVEDWNSRCTKHPYQAEDKHAVDAEAGRRRALLQVEGRALMNVWRRKIVTTFQQIPIPVSLDAGEAAASAASAPALTPEPSGDVVERLPLLITQGHNVTDEPDRDGGLALRTPSLALLRAEVAMRVQRRLNDLGYKIAIDGTWGSGSRAALRRFKKANGLLGNDAFDAETVTRLFSTLAVAAAAAPNDGEPATIETVYPPPPGADMNPLNRVDGQRIQQRLSELGYYSGRGDGTWDAAARAAFRKFKTTNSLGLNEDWDLSVETVLFDEQALRAGDPPASDPRKPVAQPAAAAVPLPPKRPGPPARAAENLAPTTPRDGLRPPPVVSAPARASGVATRTSP